MVAEDRVDRPKVNWPTAEQLSEMIGAPGITDEELDRARGEEAQRIYRSRADDYRPTASETAARLAREGWMPTVDAEVVLQAEVARLTAECGGSPCGRTESFIRRALARGFEIGRSSF